MTAGLLGLWTCKQSRRQTVVCVSPSERQSYELFADVGEWARAAGLEITNDLKLDLKLANGSRFVALPGSEKTIRGLKRVHLVIVEEAARVPDELYYAVRPFLATTNGRELLISSAYFDTGFFYETWQGQKGPDWRRFEIPATQCPRISAGFLAKEKEELPEDVFMAEYMCKFRKSAAAPFDRSVIDAALSSEEEPLFAFGGLP